MADINVSLIDLKGWGEPVSKLIDAVRSATGVRYEPNRIRRKARAEADARIILAKADIQVSEITQRAAHRMIHREVRRQENIDAIVDSAMKQLPDSVAKEPVDDGWLAGFFEQCQDVSGEQLQQLWGRLLAGEVARPGSFSLRTLGMVKVLEASDAKLFTNLRRFIWRGPVFFMLPRTNETDEFLKSAGLYPTVLAHLQTIGLMQAGPEMRYRLQGGQSTQLFYFGREHVLSIPHEARDCQIRIDLLSDIGHELVDIISVEPVEEYRLAIVANWRKMSIDVKELPPNEGGG